MGTVGEDRLKLTPQDVAVEAAQQEIQIRQARLEEIQKELVELKPARTRAWELENEARKIKWDIGAYDQVVRSKGKTSFKDAAKRGDRPSACVA